MTNGALQLASAASMTRAAHPFLPSPTTTFAGPATTDWVKSKWAYIGGLGPKFVSFVPDPYPEPGAAPESVFSVEYPKGSEGGGEPGSAGGIPSMMLGVFGDKPQGRSVITYKVAFSKGFDFVNGGKLPGIFGGYGECSGGIRNTHCFSARLMWRTHGTGEGACPTGLTRLPKPAYNLYIPEYAGFDPDPYIGMDAVTPVAKAVVEKRAFGLSLDNASWNFTNTGS
ncbi:hypothetical protein RQP46_007964 [Phenoliferia psychrophenolica]